MGLEMKKLLRWRNVWLGCAMIWIVLCHSGLDFPSRIFSYLKNWGYGGVDICLFASGLGCYFSLDRDSDGLRFLQRRVKRLAPTYLCFIGVWAICRNEVIGLTFRAVLGNVLGIQHLTDLGYSFNWYIGGLVVYYLLAPYLKALADRTKTVKGQLLVLGGLILMTIPFWNAIEFIVIVTRIPIFYIGMLCAKLCKQEHTLTGREIGAAIAVMLVGIVSFWLIYPTAWEVLWAYGLYWYPFIVITPGLCILISLVAMWLEKHRAGQWLCKIVGCIGENSFEVYLVHILLYETVIPGLTLKGLIAPNNLFWFATIPVIILGCWLLKAVTRAVSRLLFRKKAAA